MMGNKYSDEVRKHVQGIKYHQNRLYFANKKEMEYLKQSDDWKEQITYAIKLIDYSFDEAKHDEALEIYKKLDERFGDTVLNNVNRFSKEDLQYISTIYAKLSGYYVGAKWRWRNNDKWADADKKYQISKTALIKKWEEYYKQENEDDEDTDDTGKKVVYRYAPMNLEDKKECSDKLIKDIAEICNILSDCNSELQYNRKNRKDCRGKKGKLDKGRVKDLKRASKNALNALKEADKLWANIRDMTVVYEEEYQGGEYNEEDFEKYAILPHDSWLTKVRKTSLSVGGIDIPSKKKMRQNDK